MWQQHERQAKGESRAQHIRELVHEFVPFLPQLGGEEGVQEEGPEDKLEGDDDEEDKTRAEVKESEENEEPRHEDQDGEEGTFLHRCLGITTLSLEKEKTMNILICPFLGEIEKRVSMTDYTALSPNRLISWKIWKRSY